MGHCDKVTGWVVLFSLGCTANFWVKGKEMKSKFAFPFESGDALIFNGGTEFGMSGNLSSSSPFPFLLPPLFSLLPFSPLLPLHSASPNSTYLIVKTDIQHGITGIQPNTTPPHFRGVLDEFRVSIQFRQCDQNDKYKK